MKTFAHLWQYLGEFFLNWEMFQTKFVEKIKTHILCSVAFFFRKSCRLWENVEKYGRDRDHKWRHNMAHMRCMMDKQGYMHARACTRPRARAPILSTHARIHRQIRNTYCFYTTTMIRERASVLPYTCIACLVCFKKYRSPSLSCSL